MKYFGSINSTTGKHATLGQFHLFSLSAWKETELMNALKCWVGEYVYTILYYTIPYDTMLYYTILYYTILYYTI